MIQQRHYEQLAETFRRSLIVYPKGTPEHAGICAAMLAMIHMLREDNPKFNEFLFIEWVNTP